MNDRLNMLHEWLRVDLGMVDYELKLASADASFRQYYRLVSASGKYIIMDAPPAREDCRPFLDVTERLLAAGVNVPRVFTQDLHRGFLLLSDLGSKMYLDELHEDNADLLYGDAVAAVVKMQAAASIENLPVYTESLLMQEMELFRDYLLGQHLHLPMAGKALAQLQAVFAYLVEAAMVQPQVFVHRDFHSRNLILHQNNPGVIDYQDAVLGPVSYDLVSLLKDCYIKWPQAKVEQWRLQFHQQLADAVGIQVSREEFQRWFDLMGVQRHLKASGIFTRLYYRDGKTTYLQDIPRTLSYILDLKDEYPKLHYLFKLLQETVLPGLARL